MPFATMGSTSFAALLCALFLWSAGVDSHWQGHHNRHHQYRSCPMDDADKLPDHLQNKTLPSGWPHYFKQITISECQSVCSRLLRCEAIIFLINSNSDEGKGQCISLFRDQSSRVKFEGTLKLKSEHTEDAIYMVKKCPKRKKQNRQSVVPTKSSAQHSQPTRRLAKQTPKNGTKPVSLLSLRPRIKSTRPGSGCRYYKTNVTEARQVYFTGVMRNAPYARMPFKKCMAECDKRAQCDYFSIYGTARKCCLVVNQYKKETHHLKHCKKKGKKIVCSFPLTPREMIWDSYHQISAFKKFRFKGHKTGETLLACMEKCAKVKGGFCSGIIHREEKKNIGLCTLISRTPLLGRSCNVLRGEKCKLKQIHGAFTHYPYQAHVKVKTQNYSPATLMKLCSSHCSRYKYCVMVTYKPEHKGRNKWQRGTLPNCLIWVANLAMKKQCNGGNCTLVKMESFATKIPTVYFMNYKRLRGKSIDKCKAECQKNIDTCLGFEIIAAGHNGGCRTYYELNYQRKVCTAGTCKMISVKKGEQFRVPQASYAAALSPEHCIKKCAMEESCQSIGMVESAKHCRLFGINFFRPATYYKQCDANKKCTMKKAPENSFIASYWTVQKELMILKRVRGTSSVVCQEACSKEKECAAVFDALSMDLETRNCHMLMTKAAHYRKICRHGQCKATKSRAIPPSSTDFRVISKEYGPSHHNCNENCRWNNVCHVMDIYANQAMTAKTTKGKAKHRGNNYGYGTSFQQYTAKNSKFVCVVIRHQRMPKARRVTVDPWRLIDFDHTPHTEIKRFTRRCKGKRCTMAYTETTKNKDGFMSFTGLMHSYSIPECFRRCQAMPDCAFTFIKTTFGGSGKKPISRCFIAQDPTMYAKECKKRRD